MYAVTHEGARTLVDVLARRLRLVMEHADHGVSVARELAELIAPTLGWSESDISREVADFEKFITTEMAAI